MFRATIMKLKNLRIFSPPTDKEYSGTDKIGHFYGIDFLRGISAITILIWHYQHFFEGGPIPHGSTQVGMSVARSVQPFYSLFWPIYENGYWAVQAFWIISGFVFAHVYAGRKNSFGDFALARFARLYPLNIVTLFVIAILQYINMKFFGGYQVVGFNDLYHFFLNLFFIAGWGFHLGNSFNEPTWSVSIELAIYALFFLLSRRIFSFGVILPVLFFGAGLAIANQGTPLWLFGIATLYFFDGVLAYYVLIKLQKHIFLLLTGCLLSLAFFFFICLSGRFSHIPFPDLEGFLFNPIIMVLAIFDLNGIAKKIFMPVKWIGDATYSLYLWHFPIQILILTIVQKYGIHVAVFEKPVSMIIWIAGMLIVSVLSFNFIEKPLQAWSKTFIRSRLAQPDRPSKC